jgi:hypothetical protein
VKAWRLSLGAFCWGDHNFLRLEGPDGFELTFNAAKCAVAHPNGARTFTGRCARSWPKLYVIVAETQPIYVGITRQSIRSRFRLGWSADGSTGYHGYRWRHELTSASLYVWYADVDLGARSQRELETIEAEVVFGIRSTGQWPQFQTEIHFYASNAQHRRIAKRILTVVSRTP